VLETSARLLGLLSLLQSRRDWTGAELADRLELVPVLRALADRVARAALRASCMKGGSTGILGR
jgi:hypothetical protein